MCADRLKLAEAERDALRVQVKATDTIAAMQNQNKLADDIIARYEKLTANNDRIVQGIDPARLALCEQQAKEDSALIKDLFVQVEREKGKKWPNRLLGGGAVFVLDRAIGH